MTEEIMLLIVADLKNSVSKSDKEKLNSWVEESSVNAQEYYEIRVAWEKSGKVKTLVSIKLDEEWVLLKEKLIPSRRINWSQWAVAASVAMLIGFSSVFYFSKNSDGLTEFTNVEYISETGKKTISLADGTIVNLNTNSALTIAQNFGEKTRTVKLNGEAFFNVAKNPNVPFVVITDKAKTKVLGTAFNINTSSKTTKIQVEHGKVSFSGQKNSLILEKEMSAESDENGMVTRGVYDINNFAWRTGVLKFKNKPLNEVINTIQIHFGVFIASKENLSDYKLTATFDNLKIENVLEEISLIHQLQYEKTAQGFIIKKK